MGSLEIFFLMFIVIGVFVGFVVFELGNRKEHAPSTGGDNVPSHLHRGINSSSIAGEGLSGLPGLLISRRDAEEISRALHRINEKPNGKA